jgi:alkyldihydroxyacetonephosphate synthase
MKRWNGWGYSEIEMPLKPESQKFIADRLGEGRKTPDVPLSEVTRSMPRPRIKPHLLVKVDAADRVAHSAGQSLPDWIARRSGRFDAFVDGVAYPASNTDVRELLNYARSTGTRLIPFGGGTSVVGHLTPQSGEAPVIAVDMGHMADSTQFDDKNHLVTFQAGIFGPDIEAKLRARGFTLGHYPQSFEFSTLGGWIATRSSGQQSRFFGRIEQMFAGGTVETPTGTLTVRPYPASAAGPDLRELVLGSEGRLGIITEAVMRVARLPEYEEFEGIIFPSFEQGVDTLQAAAQANLPLSMLRLSNAAETATNLALSGSSMVKLLERYTALRGAGENKVMLVYGVTGNKRVARAARADLLDIAKSHGGVYIGAAIGKSWRKNRFHSAYLRNTLWDEGYGVDTVETAVKWSRAIKTMNAIEDGIRAASQEEDEPVHAFTHLSHVYATGTSVYTTFVFRLGATPEQTYRHWLRMKTAASEAIVANGGTISHQHGVGIDHAPYLEREKGKEGIRALDALFETFDPGRLMNPGKLIITREEAPHVG